MSGPDRDPPAPTILHVDLDAFYASVEQLADPSLAGRPVVVGGLGPRGVVAAASYEARRYGVASAQPMVRARRLCPGAVFLAPRFDAYRETSRRVMEVLHSFTPLVEPLALDEAFLDVAGAARRVGAAPEVGAAVRRAVRWATGLAITVGVATTKLLAKLASEQAKPDGLLVVAPGTELTFLHPLPVGRLWGVGPATLARLEALGVRTVADLSTIPQRTLVATLGQAAGHRLAELAWNRDPRRVEPDRPMKSVSREETFPADVADREALRRTVVALCEGVARTLRASERTGRTVVLKVRYPDFRTVTRSLTLPSGTDTSTSIARVALSLLDALDTRPGLRLVGVGVTGLAADEPVQQSLGLDAPAPERRGPAPGGPGPEPADGSAPSDGSTSAERAGLRRRAAEQAADEVRRRFGESAVVPATRLEPPSPDEGGPAGGSSADG